jgi:hypothetical protein
MELVVLSVEQPLGHWPNCSITFDGRNLSRESASGIELKRLATRESVEAFAYTTSSTVRRFLPSLSAVRAAPPCAIRECKSEPLDDRGALDWLGID